MRNYRLLLSLIGCSLASFSISSNSQATSCSLAPSTLSFLLAQLAACLASARTVVAVTPATTKTSITAAPIYSLYSRRRRRRDMRAAGLSTETSSRLSVHPANR